MTEKEFKARANSLWWYSPGCGHTDCFSYDNFNFCYRCLHRENDLPEDEINQ